MKRLATDILILGSGGAGLFAALHAHQANPVLSITVAVKGLLGKCGCTRMVQGGYNVALAQGDSIERHFMDTIEGGKWLPDQDLAWTLVSGKVFNPEAGIHREAVWKAECDISMLSHARNWLFSRFLAIVAATSDETVQSHRCHVAQPGHRQRR